MWVLAIAIGYVNNCGSLLVMVEPRGQYEGVEEKLLSAYEKTSVSSKPAAVVSNLYCS